MAGSSGNQLRSAFIEETTVGTTPTTPGFTTAADGFMLNAGAVPSVQRSLTALGARESLTPQTLPVSGRKQGKLVYGREDEVLETLLQGAWAANVLKDAKTIKTLSVENTIPAGSAGTSTMMRYRGVQATGGSIIMEAGQDVKYSWDMRGIGSDDGTTTAISGATYSDPSVDYPMVSSFDINTLTLQDETLDSVQRCEILFNYEDRSDQPAVGASFDLSGITPGAFLPEIKLRVYVDTNFLAIYNAARAEDEAFEVNMGIGRTTGSKYTLFFPACYFGPTELDFNSAEGFHDLTVLPVYDGVTEDCVLKITRNVS